MPRHTPVPARVRRLSAGVLVAALLIPVTATAPAQAVTLSASQERTAVTATADTKAPALSSVTRTTPENVGAGESVRLQWTSDATDIRYVYASFINETGQTIFDVAYPGEDLEMTLDPRTTAEGTYRLQSLSITDVTGIDTTYYSDGRVYTYPSAATPKIQATVEKNTSHSKNGDHHRRGRSFTARGFRISGLPGSFSSARSSSFLAGRRSSQRNEA